jgi:hypothetical protein
VAALQRGDLVAAEKSFFGKDLEGGGFLAN